MAAWQYTPYLLPLVVAGGISVALAAYAVRYARRNLSSPTVTGFTFLTLAIGAYSYAYALQLASVGLGGKLTWFWVYNVGAFAVPIAWLVFALAYAGHSEWNTGPLLAAVSVVPAVTLLAYLVPGTRTLVLADYHLETVGSFVTLAHTFGPLYLVQVAYSYALVGTGIYLITKKVATSQNLYRGQALALLIGVTVPSIAHLAFMLGLTPSNLDFTPTAFTVSGLAFGFAVFRYQLFDVLPVARDAIVEEMSDGVVVLDPYRRIVDINPVAQSLVDERETAIARPLSAVLPECARVLDATLESTEPASQETEELVTSVEGSTRYFDVQVTPLYDSKDRFTGHLLLLRDVTKRKEYEQRLEALQEATHELMEAATAAEVCEVATETASEVLELPPTAIWQYDEDRETLYPAAGTDRARDRSGDLPSIPEGAGIRETFESGDIELYDGENVVFDGGAATGGELRLPIGDHGVLVTASPVTRTFDETDIQLSRILARTVEAALDRAGREQMLRTREQELTVQNKRLDEFARVISHDLRNPLNVASGYVDVARDTGDPEAFETIDEAHQRMNQIIEDVLVLAREGKVIGETQSVTLHSAVTEAWGNVDTGEATLRNGVDRALMADHSRLLRLFENLFRNAIEHVGSDVTITVGLTDTGFYVADDGPGIPDELRDQVFDPGYSGSAEGTGLGLAIVEQIATAHGWSVRITDGDGGGGARFEVTTEAAN